MKMKYDDLLEGRLMAISDVGGHEADIVFLQMEGLSLVSELPPLRLQAEGEGGANALARCLMGGAGLMMQNNAQKICNGMISVHSFHLSRIISYFGAKIKPFCVLFRLIRLDFMV